MVGESQEAVGAGVGGSSSGTNKMPTLEEYGTNLTRQAEEVGGRLAGTCSALAGKQWQYCDRGSGSSGCSRRLWSGCSRRLRNGCSMLYQGEAERLQQQVLLWLLYTVTSRLLGHQASHAHT